MSKVKTFFKRKDIEVSLKRYGIDALGAMAQGLFCTLLVGTIFMVLLQMFGIRVFIKILSVPINFLSAMLVVLSLVGSYALNNNFFDVIVALILGLLGSGIAFLLQWAVYNFIAQKISVSIAASLIQVMPFSLLMTPLLIVFLAIGILVGAFGGAMAIRNYLKV